MTSSPTHHAAIIGGGIIGLACARALVARGVKVTLFDAGHVERSASWAAAGMLAPGYESYEGGDTHNGLTALCFAGAKAWRVFAQALETDAGMEIGYNEGLSIAVTAHQDEVAKFSGLGKAISSQELAIVEPVLRNTLAGGVYLQDDGWVDNRLTLKALKSVLAASGALFVNRHILANDPGLDAFDSILFTANAGMDLPVKPVKGVMLAFDKLDVPLERVVRCGGEYAVPRGDWTLLGATVGEVDDPRGYLISRASKFLSGLEEANPVDMWTGYRPTTPDHAPCLGRLPGHRRFVASGHYRNGILLAPLTGEIMADIILNDEVPKMASAFGPERFNVTT